MRPSDAVLAALEAQGIRGTRVTAALSGGADSVCLLHCLLTVRETLALEVAAVHVQHGLRGDESDRDEAFCRDLCARWDVPLTVETVDVTGYAAAHRCSIETAARELRYAVFDRIGGCVATAHTASDQLETMLFRLARGTGLKGLCGIPARRGQIVRPLLAVTREEVEQYLADAHLPYVTDGTNLTDDHARNVLRHHAVPALVQVNSAAVRNAATAAARLTEDEQFLADAAAAVWERRWQNGVLIGLADEPPAMQTRCIARFFEENGLPGGARRIEAVREMLAHGGMLDPDRSGRLVVCAQGRLFVRTPMTGAEVPLVMGENVIFPGHIVRAEVMERDAFEKFASIHKKFTFSALDHDIIKKYAALHPRRPGLKLRPAGRDHTVSIKKWMNASVPPEVRQTIHFLSDAEGLLWVEGLGTAARAAVTPATAHVLVLTVCHENDTGST